jgi:hypothetical protein
MEVSSRPEAEVVSGFIREPVVWTARPTQAEMIAARPTSLGGGELWVRQDCKIAQGRLSCRSDYWSGGFSVPPELQSAASSVLPRFEVPPVTAHGLKTEGARISMVLRFTPRGMPQTPTP